MLLYQNKKNHREFYIHSKRPPYRTISPVKTKSKIIDSPYVVHEKIRIFDTLVLKCQGMKLKTRDVRIPENVKRRISQTISQTVPLMQPILTLINPLTFSTLELKKNNFLHPAKSINPEQSKQIGQNKLIPSEKIVLYHTSKINQIKQAQGFYLEGNKYAGLHPWEAISIPKVKGVLEEWGVCKFENDQKYHVSMPFLGHSFRNLMAEFGKFQDCTAKYFLKQLIKTVISLNQLDLSHNRLNMDSIIHDCQGNLLINFFKSRTSPITELQRQQYMYYFSPQMLFSKVGHRSMKNDIWAIGCIALQFLSNKQIKNSKYHPYNQTSLSKSAVISSFLFKKMTQNNINHQPFQQNLHPLAIDFISTCLQQNQRKRPTSKQLLSHPYLHN